MVSKGEGYRGFAGLVNDNCTRKRVTARPQSGGDGYPLGSSCLVGHQRRSALLKRGKQIKVTVCASRG